MTMKSATKEVPKSLIYEMVKGNPIYYKGYKEVLNGTKTREEIMSDSNLQAWLKGKVFLVLSLLLSEKYDVTVGEQGLTLAKHSWRAADVAIFRFEDLQLTKHYSKTPPVVALEIDTKADLDGEGNIIEYYENKNEALLKFGIEKIIWIFTDSRKVKVITANQPARTYEWSEDVPILEDINLNINAIFEKYNRADFTSLD